MRDFLGGGFNNGGVISGHGGSQGVDGRGSV